MQCVYDKGCPYTVCFMADLFSQIYFCPATTRFSQVFVKDNLPLLLIFLNWCLDNSIVLSCLPLNLAFSGQENMRASLAHIKLTICLAHIIVERKKSQVWLNIPPEGQQMCINQLGQLIRVNFHLTIILIICICINICVEFPIHSFIW